MDKQNNYPDRFQCIARKNIQTFSTFNQKQTPLNICVRNTTTYTQPVSLNGFFFFYKKIQIPSVNV